ncbi:hypothetical protein ACJO2E_02390 [Marinobacter sp. M1N3S26]|uniref:hypothetical protein n=1 Tax=Marinobacter sp. M1N3S26 TaxID=3382299 RepID=UPI00387A89F3
MKIVGGSFGLSGKARFSGKYLEVIGDRKADYQSADVTSVNVRQEGERKFGLIGAIIGAVLLGFLLGIPFGPIGWGIGIAIAIAGSFYSTKKYFADLEFSDGGKVSLQTNDYEAKKLVQFQG